MQLIVIGIFLLTVIFSLVDGGILLHIEQSTFETRVKHADTILFGRFNWIIPINDNETFNEIHSFEQNTFEFIVYCTIKKSKAPENVARFLRVMITNEGNQ